jgi:hypothetical protein
MSNLASTLLMYITGQLHIFGCRTSVLLDNTAMGVGLENGLLLTIVAADSLDSSCLHGLAINSFGLSNTAGMKLNPAHRNMVTVHSVMTTVLHCITGHYLAPAWRQCRGFETNLNFVLKTDRPSVPRSS